MATFVDIDSAYREYNAYYNPAGYTVEDNQVAGWYREARTVSSVATRPGTRVLEMTQSLHLLHVILPYTSYVTAFPYSPAPPSGQVTPVAWIIDKTNPNPASNLIFINTGNLQRIYVDIHTLKQNDRQLISTLNTSVANARFVCFLDHIQYDMAMNPIWVHFYSKMDQVTRFSRNEAFSVSIMDQNGNQIMINDGTDPAPPAPIPAPTAPLSPNPLGQTYLNMRVTPYFRDGEYQNHGVGLTQL